MSRPLARGTAPVRLLEQALITRYNESEYNFYLRRSGGRPNRQPNRRHLLTSYGEFKGGATPDAESHLMRQLVQHAHVRHGFVRYLHNLPGCLAPFQLSLRLVVQLAHVNHGRVPLLPHPCENVLQVVVQRVHLRYDILLRERARLHGLHRRHVLLL
jgi:hypothetical protein